MRWEYYRITEDSETFGTGGDFETASESAAGTKTGCCS
jgi:hypothetical protein